MKSLFITPSPSLCTAAITRAMVLQSTQNWTLSMCRHSFTRLVRMGFAWRKEKLYCSSSDLVCKREGQEVKNDSRVPLA